MKRAILFLTLIILGTLMAFGADTATTVDTGFSFLEMVLMAFGVSTGSLGFIFVRLARAGTKAVLESLDSNPGVSNRNLLTHAQATGDVKAAKEFRKIIPNCR